MQKIFLASASLVALAACGGGSTGGGTSGGVTTDVNGISTAPLAGPEIEQLFDDVASASGVGTTTTELLNLQNVLLDEEGFDVTARDLTAPGSASYEGVVVLSDVDLSAPVGGDLSEAELLGDDLFTNPPAFAMLGRSTLNVSFGDTPTVSGGANGFIGLNIDTFIAQAENIDISPNADVSDIVAALPTVDVNGSLTYSGGEIIDFDPTVVATDDMGLGFDVDGSLQLTNALTGNGSRTVTVDGSGIAGFTENLALGVLDLNADNQTLGGAVIGVTD